MSIESKTSYSVPAKEFSFASNLLVAKNLTAQPTTDEKIQQLMEENQLLREEIRALKTIIKNIKN